MPPRAVHRFLAKKPSAMAKKTSSESPSAGPLLEFDDKKARDTEALFERRANETSEAEAVGDYNPAEGKVSRSPAMVEGGRTIKTEEVAADRGDEVLLGYDGGNVGKGLHAGIVVGVATPAEPAKPIVKVKAEENDSQVSEAALEDESDELEDMQAEKESEEILDNQVEHEEAKKDTEDGLNDQESESEYEEVSETEEGLEEDEGIKETLGNYSSEEENEDKAADADNEDVYEENEEDDYGKKQNESEIFVGGLDKDAVEDDLIKVFGRFGDIQAARIVRHPETKKSKGFAFVRFVSREDAMKVLNELKDGTEVKGKHVRIQASRDNATLYLGNICKKWTKEQVIETLKSLGIEQLVNFSLPEDSKNEGRIKGFGFLEFSSHFEAMLAFQRLKKPDAIFGTDRTARVAFSDDPLHPSEEVMLQVKTVYFEGIPSSWDEEKIKEICQEYGKIEKVLLSRNFNSKKRKDFGFVEFDIRASALACVEGINIAQIGDRDIKVRANLARPLKKSRLAKQGARGGYKVEKAGEHLHEAGHSKKKKKKKSMAVKNKEEKLFNAESVNDNKPITSQNRESTNNAKQPRLPASQDKHFKVKPNLQRGKSGKRKNHSGRQSDTDMSRHPTKKMRKSNHGSMHGRHFNGFGNQKGFHSAIREPSYGALAKMYPSEYTTASSSYNANPYIAASSLPQLRPSDLEAHAGYLPAMKQVTSSHRYDPRRPETYSNDLRSNSGYSRGIYPSYEPHTDHANYQHSGYGFGAGGGGAYATRGPY